MLVLAPENRTRDFQTINFDNLWRRSGGDKTLIVHALQTDALVAYVQQPNDPPTLFHRVPSDHWRRPQPFLEGEPGPALYCWANSDVPAQFHDLPLLFFLNEVSDWQRSLAAASLDDGMEGDYAAFDDCVDRAERAREGYWEPIATLAWVASRDERILAGAQLYEQESHAERGGPHSFPAWLTVGNRLGMTVGKTLTDAANDLREALEAGEVSGVVATEVGGSRPRPIEQHEWTQWRVAHANWGLELIPGLFKFQFPSKSVRAAFPGAQVVPQPSPPEAARVGRTPGAGQFMHTDPDFVQRMRELVVNRKVGGIDAAARKQWPDCGGLSEDAAAKRLRSKYRKKWGSR